MREMSKVTKIFIVLSLVSSFIVPIFSVLKTTRAQTTTRQNRNYINLNPFLSAIESFDIYDAETNAYIGSHPATEIYQNGDTLWTPSSDKYPKLQMFVSQPFLVDENGIESLGSESSDQTKYMVDPTRSIAFAYDSTTGEYTYLTKVTVAFDYIVKTVAHLHTPSYDFYPISPLAGIYSSHATGSGWSFSGSDIFRLNAGYTYGFYQATEWDVQQDPTPTSWPAVGVLAAGWDYGMLFKNQYTTRPNPTTWYIGNNPDRYAYEPSPKPVGIGISLEDFSDLSQMNENLAHNYGNSPLKVVVKISCDTNPNGLLYDYYRSVGTDTFNVKSRSTQMGIYDASLVQGMNVAGEVPTYVAPSDYYRVTDESASSNPSGTTGGEATDPNTGKAPTTPSTSDLPPGTVVTDFTAWYTCSTTRDVLQPMTGLVPTQTLGKPPELPIRTTVTTSNFESLLLPKQIVTMTDYIQPYSTASMATYTGRAVRFEHYYLGLAGQEQKSLVYVMLNDEFPYRMTIDNTYITHRVMMTYLVASDNEIFYVPANGNPVKVTDFTDYGINYVGIFNPNLNDAGGSVTIYSQNVVDMIMDFLSEFGWLLAVFIIGGAVIFITIAFVFLGKKKGAQQSARRSWTWGKPAKSPAPAPV